MIAAAIDLPDDALITDLDWCLRQARAPILRPMVQWVEETIILPNGPAGGERYRHYRHPVSRPFFSEIDSGRWTRIAATGPTQNGKTLMCYVLPVLYHLFEIGETVVVGLPDMGMAKDKWREDFLPVIEASEYRALLPTSGEGSRGGDVKQAIKFRNGATLRFMTAGGSDKTRAGYTTRVVAITETDGMDTAGEASREADKIEQIEARTNAFGRRGKRVYLECTVSIEKGRIWQEYITGTKSRLVRPCPACEEWVTPEREHLRGWDAARNSEEAAELAYFICPACEHRWTEEERTAMADFIRVIHGDQYVSKDGTIHGEIPRTQTLGFRWSAFDNPFTSVADLGAEEWRACHSRNPENSEKKQRQFVWTIPYVPPEIDLTPIDAEQIEQRAVGLKKGVIPPEATHITIGIDTGKRALHWVVMAHMPTGSRIIEYGKQAVEADTLGIRPALVQALERLAAYFDGGWRKESGEMFKPSQVWIDSGWHEHTDAVYDFCQAINKRLGLPLGAEIYRPTKGYGIGQRRMTPYIAPENKNKGVIHLGAQYHIGQVKRNGKTVPSVLLVHMNSDFWKSELHQRLVVGADQPGAVTLYEAPNQSDHDEFANHIVAEKQVEKYVEGKGEVIAWERVDRNNHFLDATYAALCAGDAVAAAVEAAKVVRRPMSLREMARR